MLDASKRVYSCTIFSVCQHISLDSSFKLLLIAGLNGLLLFIIFYTRKKQHIHSPVALALEPLKCKDSSVELMTATAWFNSRHRLSWLRRTLRLPTGWPKAFTVHRPAQLLFQNNRLKSANPEKTHAFQEETRGIEYDVQWTESQTNFHIIKKKSW